MDTPRIFIAKFSIRANNMKITYNSNTDEDPSLITDRKAKIIVASQIRPNSTTSEMRNISRENTLVRKFSLVVICTVEKKFAKTQAFDWFRYFVIQNTSI